MKSHRHRFWTGLIGCGVRPDDPKPPFKGAGWRAVYAQQRKRVVGGTQISIGGGKEVVIEATTWRVAQNALDLIRASMCVYSGHQDGGNWEELHLVANNEEEPKIQDPVVREDIAARCCGTTGVPAGCAIAAKASRKRGYIYAIAKCRFSFRQYCADLEDLEPFRSRHMGVSLSPHDHVLFAYAILAAYSAIEDIGLELRASRDKPSRINGAWNPVVKIDLEKRLLAAGIDATKTILWTARGPSRKIEKARPVPMHSKAPWARGQVRDCEVQIVDAIAYLDWLRDKVAAHKTRELASVLSPYDVVNAQHVTRHLLLESLGWLPSQRRKRTLTSGSTGAL